MSERESSLALPAVYDLRSQLSTGGRVIGHDSPRLSWRIAAADTPACQSAYELEAAADKGFRNVLATSGIVSDAGQVAVPAPGGSLRSREVRFYRVRARLGKRWTAWSPSLCVEAGLLASADWQARAITLPGDRGAEFQSPSPLLRREFVVAARVARARLYSTAHGVYKITINGVPVADDLLAPGWSAYRKRILVDTYDVADLLVEGANVIGGYLGDGWYRGRLGWEPISERCRYGEELGLVAQLEIDLETGERLIVATDGTWRASTGEILSADIYDGSVMDLRKRQIGWDRVNFDDRAWLPARVVPFDFDRVEPRVAPPVRPVAVLPVQPIPDAPGRRMFDGGQNMAGFVRLRVRGKAGDSVAVRHAEVLEADGSLHTKSLRTAKATDRYILADDLETTLEPAFTFHGFRYAEVETEADIVSVEFVAISAGIPRRGTFACADASLTRFHENVVWSQRSNFVSIPSDCPQRDERLGWTGDAQAFAATSCLLFDPQRFWASWLRDLALDQDPALGVSTVVPDVVLQDEPRFGRAGWADAATIVPWAVYEATGDPEILRAQLDSMQSHVHSLVLRTGDEGLLDSSFQFGDWLDPDAPPDRPADSKADPTFLANAYFAHSARLVADAARVLGIPDVELRHRALAGRVAQATWRRWRDHAVTNQTGCAVALELGVAPADQRSFVAGRLAQLVREANGRVATGFIGTSLVLPALASEGYFDEAYMMLLRREMPSWLYQVERGATTVWERWDSLGPDGSIHSGKMSRVSANDADEGQMLSFNHYAYGAVVGWVYRHVAGLAPDVKDPGYRHIVVGPRPASAIGWARSAIETPYGLASINWRLTKSSLVVDLRIPEGARATFVAPAGPNSQTILNGCPVSNRFELKSGTHSIVVTQPLVAEHAPLAASSRS
jgi:alpha-L-rhamnosidase